ncbi:hypothetical protein SUGI_0966170 [Cryptomeria japonica]|nr:hypothetical protein SUGI_0966170 [Cryptomeria japonica]
MLDKMGFFDDQRLAPNEARVVFGSPPSSEAREEADLDELDIMEPRHTSQTTHQSMGLGNARRFGINLNKVIRNKSEY